MCKYSGLLSSLLGIHYDFHKAYENEKSICNSNSKSYVVDLPVLVP